MFDFVDRVGFDRFVVKMPVGEVFSGGAECPEVGGVGDAGEHFFEVGGEAGCCVWSRWTTWEYGLVMQRDAELMGKRYRIERSLR